LQELFEAGNDASVEAIKLAAAGVVELGIGAKRPE